MIITPSDTREAERVSDSTFTRPGIFIVESYNDCILDTANILDTIVSIVDTTKLTAKYIPTAASALCFFATTEPSVMAKKQRRSCDMVLRAYIMA